MYDPWSSAFGSDLNLGINSATVQAGNGEHNRIDGNVTATADQSVGDGGFGGFHQPAGGNLNLGLNGAAVEAGDGDHNHIGGNVTADASQHVGDGGFGFGPHDLFGGPLVGDINVGVNTATVLAGNGFGNHIDGNVTATAHQDVGDHGFFPIF